MTELNKRGGAVILDCLTEKEIAAIMIAHVEKNFGDSSDVVKAGSKVYAKSAGGAIKLFRVSTKTYRELIGKKAGDIFKAGNKDFKITAIK